MAGCRGSDGTEGRWKYFVATAFLLVAAGIRAAVSSPIPAVHAVVAPYGVLEIPFIFVGALLWLGFMLDGRWLLSTALALLAVVAYWVVTTGVGFA